MPEDWRAVYDFWFPAGLDDAGFDVHRRMFDWWMAGGSNAELPRFARIVEAARAGRLDNWRDEPLGRLSLIIVLDQFPRGLFAGTPQAYASDAGSLRLAEEGLVNDHYASLTGPWEKMFFAMPLAHAEGPDHRQRLERLVAMVETVAVEAPLRLQALCQFSVGQVRGHLDVIVRFGRFPHRNAILGRASTAAELAYLAKGEFVHKRRPPDR
jgi:uncharacterized protein (DUF924 family)